MERGIPRAVLFAALMVALLLATAALSVTLDLAHSREPRPQLAIDVFYIGWAAVVLVGISRRSAWAWRAGWGVAAIVGTAQALVAIVFLRLSFADPKCLPGSAWHLSAAIFMYTLFYLLLRPTATSYFTREERGDTRP
jgi:hypothetical protein